nr:HPr family phosphocarrier protein [Texcoconibacillus texcoconensis]
MKVLKPIFADTASTLVNTASQYPETILLKKEHWVIDAKSLLGVLALALQPAQIIEVTTDDGEPESFVEEVVKTGIFEKVE